LSYTAGDVVALVGESGAGKSIPVIKKTWQKECRKPQDLKSKLGFIGIIASKLGFNWG